MISLFLAVDTGMSVYFWNTFTEVSWPYGFLIYTRSREDINMQRPEVH